MSNYFPYLVVAGSFQYLVARGTLEYVVERRHLQPGDHIYTRRGLRAHHGIYKGGDQVVHFITASPWFDSPSQRRKGPCSDCDLLDYSDRSSGVVVSCLDCFRNSQNLYRYGYGVSAMAFLLGSAIFNTTAESGPVAMVLERAENLLTTNGFGVYNFFTNNCENFATYCKTGSSWNKAQALVGRGGNTNPMPAAATSKLEELELELSKIVGLHGLKLQLQKWAKGMLLDEKRRAIGVDLSPRKPPHMAFLGNPGTGKTTVARILGKLLCSVGVLSSDKVTEVQRTDLVGQYIGQTGPKTRIKIEEAMGGILFVDEAYRLAPPDNIMDYGKEALEEIMSVLEDGHLLVIFAGYTEPMKRVFSSNQGFCRRVTHFFQFDDFSSRELAEMLLVKMSKQDKGSRLYGFKLDSCCSLDAVASIIERKSSEEIRNKMNGGLVDHLLNNARENLDSRVNFEAKGDELLTITLSDLEAGLEQLMRRSS